MYKNGYGFSITWLFLPIFQQNQAEHNINQ